MYKPSAKTLQKLGFQQIRPKESYEKERWKYGVGYSDSHTIHYMARNDCNSFEFTYNYIQCCGDDTSDEELYLNIESLVDLKSSIRILC